MEGAEPTAGYAGVNLIRLAALSTFPRGEGSVSGPGTRNLQASAQ